MGFRNGAFVKVWEVQPKNEKRTTLRVTISRKRQDTSEYVQEFTGFIDCIGTACADKASKLKDGDRIKLVNCDVSNSYDKDKGVTYWNCKVFAFESEEEFSNDSGSGQPASRPPQQQQNRGGSGNPFEDGDDGNLPF